MKYIIIYLSLFSILVADINISGDARFRPRYDLKVNGDESSTGDMYYLYRARINLKADIDDGWFFNSKIGTNGTAGMAKMGTVYGDDIAYSYKPTVSFMELYFGHSDEKSGLYAGIFPLKNNPSLDLHYYPSNLVDIPFALFNNGTVIGTAGYETLFNKRLNWFVSVDLNETNVEKDTEGNSTELTDYETVGLDMTFNISNISLTPRFLKSFGGNDDSFLPTTYGMDVSLPKLSGFSSGFSYYLSSTNGSEDDAGHYKANHMRVSVNGPIAKGKLKFFYDIANMSNDNNEDDKVSYMWLSYNYTLYKGEKGEFTLNPTYRLQTGKNAGASNFDEDFTRSKFEVTMQMKFK